MSQKPIIFYRGEKFTVEFAIQSNGNSDSYEFLKSLNPQLNTKITALIKRFADSGKIKSREQFKKVEDTNFFEFKSFQTRIFMYNCAKGVIALTNGFIKKKDKIPKEEIKKAKRIIKEYDIKRKEICHE